MRRDLEVVVVDDEIQITDILSTFIPLVIDNVQVHVFNDPIIAKEYITSNHVDVVITDYKMPGMDGLQLLESAPPESTKIVISGFMSDIGEEQLRMLNATFFEKPVPLGSITNVIIELQKKIR